MDDDSPGLGVGFQIDFGDSFGGLKTLDDLIGTFQANAVREFQRLEAEVKKGLGLSEAARQYRDLDVAATRAMDNVVKQTTAASTATSSMIKEAAAAVRETRRIAQETAAATNSLEGYIKSTDRQTFAIGRSREEQRQVRIEQQVAIAQAAGHTEVVDRLRASQAALYDAQFALMRRQKAEAEAVAEAEVVAANQAAAAKAADEQATRSATWAYEKFNAVAKQRMAAFNDDQKAAAAQQREIDLLQQRAVAEQAVINQLAERAQIEAALERTTGVGRVRATDNGASFSALAAQAAAEEAREATVAAAAVKQLADEHARLAAMVRGSNDAQVADAAAAERLRAATDPLYAATRRLNDEIAESTRLYYAGATAPGEYARQQQVLAQSLRDVEQAHHAAAGGVGKLGSAARLSRGDMLNLGYQINDIVVSLISGQKPFMVFAQQGAQIGQIAASSGVGMGGMARALGGLAAGFLPLIGIAAVAVGGLALFDRSVSKGIDTQKMVDGLGLTRSEIKRLEDTSITSGDVIKATFQVMAERVGLDLSSMKTFFSDAMDAITKIGADAMAGLYAGIVGTFDGIALAARDLKKGDFTGFFTDWDKAMTGRFNEARGALNRFGADVSKQAAANKKADLERQAAEIKKDRTPKVDRHAEQLAREAAATEAQIAGLYRLAEAYGVSGGAALIAEAQMKATTAAIKRQGDIDEFVARQVRLTIVQRVADAAKETAAMREHARIQTEVNGMVAAGTIPAARANEIMQERIADLPLLAALEAARTVKDLKGIAEVTAALDARENVRARGRSSEKGAFYTAAEQDAARQLDMQQQELRLVGATDAERVRALATLKATQELQAKGYDTTDAFAKGYIANQVAIAIGAQAITDAQRDYNDALSCTADRWDIIAGKVQSAAQGMADAFGGAGRAIGDMASIYAIFTASRERADVEHQRALKAAGTPEAKARENALFALRTAGAQIEMYGDMASAAKGFFKEGSAGYKTLAAVEKAYRTVQFAMSVQAMIQNAAETLGFVTGSAARATAAGAEGVATQSKLPFPANIAAMAATAAALVAAGIAIVGGGSGGRTAPVTNTGTGTVLGDGSAKSESIKNAIDALKEVDTLMLTTSRTMAASLKSIDSQIGGLAAVLVRSGNLSADSQVATKTPTGILGSLFGTRIAVTGSGLYGAGQSIGDILGGGFDAQTYSDVLKTKKFLGITTSKKTGTVYGQADAAVSDQFALILRSFNDAIVAAAGPLGQSTNDIASRVSGFVFTLGKIDLSGLTGTEIQEKLTAVFGAAADGMASGAFPGIERFQKVGEGAFETLVRVASTVEQVTASLDQLGAATRGLSIDAKVGLADQFESVSAMRSAIDGYFEAFYTPAEQNAARLAQLGTVFTSLGTGMPATLAGFRSLVEAQDLTTSAGQATYATLLQLAPAFADLNKELGNSKSAADILSERSDLQRKLLELNGDTAAIRALDLAKLDASNRGLQQQVYAVQDAQSAAAAAKQLQDAWKSVGDTIMDEVRRIRGLSATGGDGSFASLMGQFNVATASARGGDQDAAKMLPGLSQSLLKAAADVATSRQELARVQAQTAASLEATYGVIGALTGNGPASTTATLAAAATATQATTSPTAANDALINEVRALRSEVASMRSENNSGHAATASNTGRTARKLEDVTAASGGDAISTVAAA